MWRKIFYLIVFGLFLVYLGRFLYFTKIVENVCSQVAGVGVRELRGIINDRDLRFSGDYSDRLDDSFIFRSRFLRIGQYGNLQYR